MNLRNKIPSIYHSFLPELLDIEFPSEEIATCDNCTLCRSSKSPFINTKCCNYYPHLPNFLAGGVLFDNDQNLAIGKERIFSQIEAKSGITPYGIIPSHPYSLLKKETDILDFSTQSKDAMDKLLCPYYSKGNCSIWKYRENLCVTFFCSSIGGGAGKRFWNKVNDYLKMAETNLSQYAMLMLGWPVDKIITEAVTISNFNFENEQGEINEENYTKLWGNWVGKEVDFYKNCFEIVKNINSATFQRLTGLKREILEDAIRETQKEFILNRLPNKLILHPSIVFEELGEGYTLLVLGKNSVEMPTAILPLIRGFNGKRTTVEVFHLAFNILFKISNLVDELRKKGILLNA